MRNCKSALIDIQLCSFRHSSTPATAQIWFPSSRGLRPTSCQARVNKGPPFLQVTGQNQPNVLIVTQDLTVSSWKRRGIYYSSTLWRTITQNKYQTLLGGTQSIKVTRTKLITPSSSKVCEGQRGTLFKNISYSIVHSYCIIVSLLLLK